MQSTVGSQRNSTEESSAKLFILLLTEQRVELIRHLLKSRPECWKHVDRSSNGKLIRRYQVTEAFGC